MSEGDESYGPSSQRSSLALSDTEPEDPEYAELNPLDMVDVRELLSKCSSVVLSYVGGGGLVSPYYNKLLRHFM